jgi:hypothetical protein
MNRYPSKYKYEYIHVHSVRPFDSVIYRAGRSFTVRGNYTMQSRLSMYTHSGNTHRRVSSQHEQTYGSNVLAGSSAKA